MLTEQILEYLEKAGIAITLFAVAVIIVGFAVAAWRYARRLRATTPDDNFNRFKIELGSALILALEILILADVLETITVRPTLLSLAFLASIVVVRTAVSWSLTLEVEGCWPWQATKEDQGNA